MKTFDHEVGPPTGTGSHPSLGYRVTLLVACVSLVVSFALLLHVDAAGTALAVIGGRDPSPLSYVGQDLDTRGCRSVPMAVGRDELVMCSNFTAAVTPKGKTEVISVYAEDNSVVSGYTGALPSGLKWGQTITEVRDLLGKPHRITDMYGTPTMVYMFMRAPYGSLELQFDGHDTLVQINACLTH